MEPRQPSRTARGAAAHRAAHQILEKASIFADPFACAILGEAPEAIAAEEAAQPQRAYLRLFVTARSRFAEDALALAVARGVRQLVVLGAGLDTFALRNPHAARGLRVFEVDHAGTQLWKRARLGQAGIAIPPSLAFVTADFEHPDAAEGLLAGALAAAGFEPARPAFFIWLGVTAYLTQEAVAATLSFVAALPGAELVFDYSEPPENFQPERRRFYDAAAEQVAALGEPWISHFQPADIASRLHGLGFAELEDLAYADCLLRYAGKTYDAISGKGGPHVLRARRLD